MILTIAAPASGPKRLRERLISLRFVSETKGKERKLRWKIKRKENFQLLTEHFWQE